MTTIQKTPVVLNSPHDWEVWFNMVRSRAVMASIWKFIDPSIPKDELPMPTKAALPLPSDINPDKMLISDLTSDELEELKTRREERKDYNREYDKQRLALENLSNLIYKTVSRSYHIYLLEKDTIHDMLTALKQRIASTDRARQIEYIAQYQKLKKPPQSQNIDDWIKL